MIPQNIETLVISLTEKTNQKQAIWGKTARQDEFKLIFGKGAITIDSWIENHIEMLDLSIYNINGDRIEYFLASNNSEEFFLFKELHNAAKREYYKVEETINSLLDEISSNENVGKKENTEKDDLPF